MSEIPIPNNSFIPDARTLRAEGKVAGTRPEIELEHTSLNIEPVTLESAPKGPLDLVIAFGYGEVEPVLVGRPDEKDVTINKARMRHGALATLELAVRGYIKPDGIIALSGTATANPPAVEAAVASREKEIMNQESFVASLGAEAADLTEEQIYYKWMAYQANAERTIRRAPTEEDAEKVYKKTEGDLMHSFLAKAHSKVSTVGSNETMTIADTGIEVFVDNLATETADNYIFVLNELDRRSRAANGKLFEGSIGLVASNYHIARVTETGRALGLGKQLVPIVSQEVLRKSGYLNELYSEAEAAHDVNPANRGNENKWIRTLYGIPEYFLPMIAQIEDNERFINTLMHSRDMYGEEAMQRLGLQDLRIENTSELKAILSKIKRLNPIKREWMDQDVSEVNRAIDEYREFTGEWMAANASTQIPA